MPAYASTRPNHDADRPTRRWRRVVLAVIAVTIGGFLVATGSVALSATDGRDVIWSGACSSGGNKVQNRTFTPTGSSAVTANVQ